MHAFLLSRLFKLDQNAFTNHAAFALFSVSDCIVKSEGDTIVSSWQDNRKSMRLIIYEDVSFTHLLQDLSMFPVFSVSPSGNISKM